MSFPKGHIPGATEITSSGPDGEGHRPPWAEWEDNQYFRELELAHTDPYDLLPVPQLEKDLSPISEPEGGVKELSERETEAPGLGGTEPPLPQNCSPEGESSLIPAPKGDLLTGGPHFSETGLMKTAIYPGQDAASEGATDLVPAQAPQTIYKLYVKEDDGYFSCTYPGCDEPKAAFKKRYNVERHIRTRHTGESAAICEGCGHRFSRKDNEKTHKCPQAATTTSRRKKRRQRY